VTFEHVETRDVVKLWGATRALAGVSVRFDAGAITVVEGPNGSGKSTLLALLAQLARPTAGTIHYGALDARRAGAAVRARIGVLAHAAMLYPDLTARENLALFARLFAVDGPTARVAALIERFELGGFGARPTRTCSRGQLQRVALARALLHEPTLLLLDEPSTGLDVASTDRLVTAVRAEKDRGAIVVLVTHDTSLADLLADRRVRLERGRLVTPDAERAA
jgi:heme exporter protein A